VCSSLVHTKWMRICRTGFNEKFSKGEMQEPYGTTFVVRDTEDRVKRIKPAPQSVDRNLQKARK
jgi:hypothetical protein